MKTSAIADFKKVLKNSEIAISKEKCRNGVHCTVSHEKETDSSFLVNNLQNSTLSKEWTKQQKRAFQRLNSGFTKHKGEIPRFITLTTPENLKQPISESFKVLSLRIRRLTLNKLVEKGYLKEDNGGIYYEINRKVPWNTNWRDKMVPLIEEIGGEAWKDRGYRIIRYKDKRDNLHEYLQLPLKKKVYIPSKDKNKAFKFEYLKIETLEGANGVFHIPYFGNFIPQKWLKDNWFELTGAEIVDIRAVKRPIYNSARLAAYFINQYLAGQNAFKRYSTSSNWVFKGFTNYWYALRDLFGKKGAIIVWNKLLEAGKGWFESPIYYYWVKEDGNFIKKKVNQHRGFFLTLEGVPPSLPPWQHKAELFFKEIYDKEM